MLQYWILLIALLLRPTVSYVNTCNGLSLFWHKSTGPPQDANGYYQYDDETKFYIYKGNWVSASSDNVEYLCGISSTGWTHTQGYDSFDDCYTSPANQCWDYRPGEERWKIYLADTYGDGWGALDGDGYMIYSRLYVYNNWIADFESDSYRLAHNDGSGDQQCEWGGNDAGQCSQIVFFGECPEFTTYNTATGNCDGHPTCDGLTMIWLSGTADSEISFRVIRGNTVLWDCTNGLTCTAESNCEYYDPDKQVLELEMQDSGVDGWNGAKLLFYTRPNVEGQRWKTVEYTMDSGSTKSVVIGECNSDEINTNGFCVCKGLKLEWVQGTESGKYDDEISFQIKSGDTTLWDCSNGLNCTINAGCYDFVDGKESLRIHLQDSYDNGWNGAILKLEYTGPDGHQFTTDIEMLDGSSQTNFFGSCPSFTTYNAVTGNCDGHPTCTENQLGIVWSPGSSDSETSFVIKRGDTTLWDCSNGLTCTVESPCVNYTSKHILDIEMLDSGGNGWDSAEVLLYTVKNGKWNTTGYTMETGNSKTVTVGACSPNEINTNGICGGCSNRFYTEYQTTSECATKRRCQYYAYAEYDLEGIIDNRVCMYKRPSGSGFCRKNCKMSVTFGVEAACRHGSYCTPTCEFGYTLIGEALYCDNGVLSGTAECVASCSYPAYPGRNEKGISCAHNELCSLTCEDGYFERPNPVTCVNGTFNNDMGCLQQCTLSGDHHEDVECLSKSNTVDTTLDESCDPQCEDGYTLLGGGFCYDGTLTSTARCEQTCEVSVEGDNVGLGDCPGNLTSEATCTLNCTGGTALAWGSYEASCHDGTFSYELQCEELCDNKPTEIENGILEDCNRLYAGGPACNVTCFGGYNGTGEIRCNTDGTISNDADCSSKMCGLLTGNRPPYYAENMKEGSCYAMQTNSQCVPECKLGYKGNDEEGGIWKCPDGNWENDGFKCIPKSQTEFMYYDPSNGEFSWNGVDKQCNRLGKYAKLSLDGMITCEYCNYTQFTESYHKPILSDEVDQSYHHGACCANPHHTVCEKMWKEYKKNCELSLKGVQQRNENDGEINSVQVTPTATTVNEINVGFYDQEYTACQGSIITVTWNGNHDIQETTEAGYTSCSASEYMNDEISTLQTTGHQEVINSLYAIAGETRYFVCTQNNGGHCLTGAKFKITCPNNN